MAAELVPTDQPYGDRKQTESTRRQFGVPVDSPQAPAPPAAVPSVPESPQSGGGLGFDPLQELGPLGMENNIVQPSFRERIVAAAAASPSAGFREAAKRILRGA